MPLPRLAKSAFVFLLPSLLAAPYALFLWAVAESSHRGSDFLRALVLLGPPSLWVLGAVGLFGVVPAIICLILLRRSANESRATVRRVLFGIAGAIVSLAIAWVLYSSDKLNMTWWW